MKFLKNQMSKNLIDFLKVYLLVVIIYAILYVLTLILCIFRHCLGIIRASRRSISLFQRIAVFDLIDNALDEYLYCG